MSHYEPKESLINCKDVLCAWSVAVAFLALVFFVLSL